MTQIRKSKVFFSFFFGAQVNFVSDDDAGHFFKYYLTLKLIYCVPDTLGKPMILSNNVEIKMALHSL